jgi:hypothetical protein
MTDEYAEIHGERTYELPPLLIYATPYVRHSKRMMDAAEEIIDSEDLMAPRSGEPFVAEAAGVEQRKWDLALNLMAGYRSIVAKWRWGKSVLEWVRQCEITFDHFPELRMLLHCDVWPHGGRSSFVKLLEDKEIGLPKVDLERAIGVRLTFRQPPPWGCCSNQLLLYLDARIAQTAYDAWAEKTPPPVLRFPPERFHCELIDMGVS